MGCALTDFQVPDATLNPDSTFSRQVLQDQWLAVFGPPYLIITDGGTEFAGGVQALLELFGVMHEVVPGCKVAAWASLEAWGHLEAHDHEDGQVTCLCWLAGHEVGGPGLRDGICNRGLRDGICNRAGFSPCQAVTGAVLCFRPLLCISGQVKFRFNEELTRNDALA